jgi:hypothetical protein
VPSNCLRRADDPGPTPASSVPWGIESHICRYGGVRTFGTAALVVVVALLSIGVGAVVAMLRRRKARVG